MATNQYKIDVFDIAGFDEIEKELEKLDKSLSSIEYMQFIKEKCVIELNTIMENSMILQDWEQHYKSSHHYQVSKDRLRIFNDSMVDLSELSEKTRSRYANGLSLAKLIEFGTGIPRNR